MNDAESQMLLDEAVNWIKNNEGKEPQFSTGCGMVFNENSAADDFDDHMGAFARNNKIKLTPMGVVNLYFDAVQFRNIQACG